MLKPGLYEINSHCQFYETFASLRPAYRHLLRSKDGKLSSPNLPAGSLVFYLGTGPFRTLKVILGEKIGYILFCPDYSAEFLLTPTKKETTEEIKLLAQQAKAKQIVKKRKTEVKYGIRA
jgi:hypothetical protein